MNESGRPVSSGVNVLTHRSVLAIAVPVMLSNVSTPLIGIVDTAVVGRIPNPAYIGAVAVGALMFSFIFWAFGFLRMGTTGLTAQAFGREDDPEIRASLGRALLIAGFAGCILIAIQLPLRAVAFGLLAGSEQVESLARAYFDIRIWAAPATLANYAILGWFIGLGRTDIGLVLQLVLNVSNMLLDALFVIGFGWDVRGVAAGTLLAEFIAAAVGLVYALRHAEKFGRFRIDLPLWLHPAKLQRTIAVNADIMIRSLALVFVFVWFMARGAAAGDVVLAANAVLMQFNSVSAFFLDGLAFAAEALVGRAIGARRHNMLLRAIRLTTVWAVATAAVIVVVLWSTGGFFIDALTVDPETRAAARTYLPWAACAPLLGVWAFQLDGIFIGATLSREMRNAMLLATAIYLIAWWMLSPLGNHGLWAALWVSYLARIATLARYLPRLVAPT
ncbi:MAG TPA: MATE family efflux transporter [Gammaproteobacteria bacterium]|nr:MATE family efflux transporter [Gammaproteobacteria bacterium]